MAAAYGVAVYQGLSGRRYSIQIYLDDVAGNKVKFDNGLGDASKGDIAKSFPEAVILQDFCLAGATAQTKTAITRNDVSTGDTLLNAIHLASVTFRPQLSIGFVAGAKMGAVQVA